MLAVGTALPAFAQQVTRPPLVGVLNINTVASNEPIAALLRDALARQLVAAGLADRPMVIRYHGLAGTMIYHSFHTAAISMSMEWANSYASRSTADVRPVQG